MRLDKLVSGRFGLSRHHGQAAVRRWQVDLAGLTCFDPGQEVEPDAAIAYDPNRPRPATAAQRIYASLPDRHILIVNKPAGLLTRPKRRERRARGSL